MKLSNSSNKGLLCERDKELSVVGIEMVIEICEAMRELRGVVYMLKRIGQRMDP